MINIGSIQRHIVIRPDIQHGKPCIKSARTPVHVILEALASGMTFEQIQKEYAPITQDEIRACILYAALLADEHEVASPTAA